VPQANACVSSFFVGPELSQFLLAILGHTSKQWPVIDTGFRMTGGSLPNGRRAQLHAEMCKLVVDRILTVDTQMSRSRSTVLIWPGIAVDKAQKDEFVHFDELKVFVGKCLQAALHSNHWLQTGNSDVDTTSYVRSVLRICRKLVTLGLYGTDSKHLSEETLDSLYLLTEPLVKLLQYQNTELLQCSKTTFDDEVNTLKSAYMRSEKQSDAAAMILVKSEVCKILAVVLKIEEDHFLKRFILEIHRLQTERPASNFTFEDGTRPLSIKFTFEDATSESFDEALFDNPVQDATLRRSKSPAGHASNSRNLLSAPAGAPHEADFHSQLWKAFQALRDSEHKAFDFVSLCRGDPYRKPFRQALRQLLEVGNVELTQDVLELATRRYSITEHLVRSFHNLKLLADETVASDHVKIRTWAGELAMYDATSSVWVSSGDKTTMDHVVDTINNLSRLCAAGSFGKLTPDPLRQEILRLEKLHQTVVRILIAIDGPSPNEGAGNNSVRSDEHLFNACCYFVKQFAASSPRNQLAMFYTGIHKRLSETRDIERTTQLVDALESLARGAYT
jgi:hypothetical protein